MTLEQTIEKAIEGGWKPEKYGFPTRENIKFVGFELMGEKLEIYTELENPERDEIGKRVGQRRGDFWIHITQPLLDPLFWQALGKAMGWVREDFEICFGCGVRITEKTPDRKSGKHYGCGSDIEWFVGQWSFEWHSFIDHLAEGKSIESYFEQF